MNTRTHRFGRTGGDYRSTRGGVIVEGAAMLTVMVPVLVLLILCLINTYFVTSYNLKLQAIAASGAREVMANRWWLGMTRTDYSNAAEQNTSYHIDEQLRAIGLKLKGHPTYTYTLPGQVKLRRKAITVVRVDFEVDGLKIAKGGFMVPGMSLHATGVSSDSEHAVTRNGQAFIAFRDPETQFGVGIRVPIYNATNGHGQPAQQHLLRMGRSAGTYPVAYLRVEVPHAGHITRVEDITDAANNVTTTETGRQFAWPDRAY